MSQSAEIICIHFCRFAARYTIYINLLLPRTKVHKSAQRCFNEAKAEKTKATIGKWERKQKY